MKEINSRSKWGHFSYLSSRIIVRPALPSQM